MLNQHSRTFEDAHHTSYRSKGRVDRYLLFALLLSLLLHAGFLFVSQNWKVNTLQSAEENMEKLFRIQLADLQSYNFVSRPTQLQLQEERERVLQQSIESIADLPIQPLESELDNVPPAITDETIPSWQDKRGDDLFVDDQAAQNLITTDVGDNEIADLERLLGKDIFTEEIETNRIALVGRGTGTGRRIMADLPAPVLDADPSFAQDIAMEFRPDLAPPAPDIEISEPQIELPPVNEILPSPELIRESPVPTDLKTEELAKQEIKDKFVQLDDLVRVELFTYHHIGGDGYFMVRIRPITADERLKVLPKDVLFVLDASRSMGERRLSVIQNEVVNLLERLRPDDRFNIIGFKQSIKQYAQTFAPVNPETVKNAKFFTNRLESSGKTDIYSSLHPIVQLGTERARPLIMILFSDGRPTVGVVNSRRIINDLTRFRGPSSSIFCIGTGSTINRYLLDMLAFRNRGLVAFESDRSELPAMIQSVYGYIEDPVLLQIQANFDLEDTTEVYPKVLPDLYLKGELKIWGRLRDEKEITLRLVGEAFDEHKEMIIKLPVPERDNGTYQIARDWAFHKIYHLVGKMVEVGEQQVYLDEINLLSRTYNVITPYSEQ